MKQKEFLKHQQIKEPKKKPIQLDMVGLKDALEGGLPSVEMKKDMPLEKATKEAAKRKELQEKQMDLLATKIQKFSEIKSILFPYDPGTDLFSVSSTPYTINPGCAYGGDFSRTLFEIIAN